MNCIQCGVEHERKGMYCSKRCTDKAYRERKKAKNIIDESPDEVELIIDIPKEEGVKQRWCNFCGASIENSPKLGFCDNEHEKNYWLAIRLELPLKIKIDSKTIVETRRYHKVQDIIEAMLNRNKLGVTFF
jgi:hypothetical protein